MRFVKLISVPRKSVYSTMDTIQTVNDDNRIISVQLEKTKAHILASVEVDFDGDEVMG